MAKSKNKKSKSNKPKNQPPIADNSALQVNPLFKEDPWLTSVYFSPLVVGSAVASGLREPELAAFSLILFPLMIAYYVGVFVADQTLKQATPKLVGFVFAEVVLVASFYNITSSLLATVLLSAVIIFTLALKGLSPRSAFSVVLHCLMLVFSMAMFAVLGVFGQTNRVVLQTSLLGLVTGSMLAASLVAKHGTIFERVGYKRSLRREEIAPFANRVICLIEKYRKKKDETPSYPGFPAQLYTTFLMAVPCLIIMFIPLGAFPISFLLIAVAQIPAPKLATVFLNKTAPDQGIEKSTIKLAALNSFLALIGGLFVR